MNFYRVLKIVSNQKKPRNFEAFFGNKNCYFTFINSTSKINVAFGGITPPAPRSP